MAVFGLIAGISGVKNWQKPAAAGKGFARDVPQSVGGRYL